MPAVAFCTSTTYQCYVNLKLENGFLQCITEFDVGSVLHTMMSTIKYASNHLLDGITSLHVVDQMPVGS